MLPRQKFFLPVLDAIFLILVFSFPGMRIFVFLAPLLILFFLKKEAGSSREAAFGAGLAFFLFAVFLFSRLNPDPLAWSYVRDFALAPNALFWFLPIFFLLVVLFSLWISLPYALLGLIFFRLKKNSFSDAFLFALLWPLAEFLRAKIFFGIPWVNLGYFLFDSLPFLGISARFWGVLGLSFLASLLAGLLFFLFFDFRLAPRSSKLLFTSALLPLLLLWFWGREIFAEEKLIFQEAKESAVAVHGYIPWGWQEEREEVASGLWLAKNYVELLGSLEGGGPKFLVLPEEVLPPADPERNLYQWLQEVKGLREIRESTGAEVLVLGQSILKEDKLYNNFLILDGARDPKFQFKYRLFPFVEYLPLGKNFARKILPNAFLFQKGEAPKVLETSGGKVAVFSCLELLDPVLVRKQVNSGAEILLSGGSEIAWEKPVWQQDLLVSRVEAASNKRFLVRAMKEGYSAIVSPLGEVLDQSNGKDDKLVRANVELVSEKTLYTKLGDNVIAGIFLFLSLLLTFWTSRGIRDQR